MADYNLWLGASGVLRWRMAATLLPAHDSHLSARELPHDQLVVTAGKPLRHTITGMLAMAHQPQSWR